MRVEKINNQQHFGYKFKMKSIDVEMHNIIDLEKILKITGSKDFGLYGGQKNINDNLSLIHVTDKDKTQFLKDNNEDDAILLTHEKFKAISNIKIPRFFKKSRVTKQLQKILGQKD